MDVGLIFECPVIKKTYVSHLKFGTVYISTKAFGGIFTTLQAKTIPVKPKKRVVPNIEFQSVISNFWEILLRKKKLREVVKKNSNF